MRWIVLMLLGCGGKSSDPPPLPEFDEAPVVEDSGTPTEPEDTAEPEPDFCEDAPLLTWENFGRGFITEACQGCHASTAANRYGAPDEVIFDTVEITWEQVDRVLARGAGDYPSMPPLGGTTDMDRLKLEYWLLCGEEGR